MRYSLLRCVCLDRWLVSHKLSSTALDGKAYAILVPNALQLIWLLFPSLLNLFQFRWFYFAHIALYVFNFIFIHIASDPRSKSKWESGRVCWTDSITSTTQYKKHKLKNYSFLNTGTSYNVQMLNMAQYEPKSRQSLFPNSRPIVRNEIVRPKILIRNLLILAQTRQN